jgi:TatD DNase family protein
LAPAPHRGKTNDPSLVPWVAKKIAEIKGLSDEVVATHTTDNFLNLFHLIN